MHEVNFINGIRLEAFKGNVGELLSIGTDGIVCISASIQSITGGLNNRVTTLETNTSGITGGVGQLDTRYSGSNFVHLTGNETISGNKTFINQISSPKGSGAGNEGFGYLALSSNVVGVSNTAIGYEALKSNTNNQNTAIGYQALNKNTSGYNNVALGYIPLYKNIDGYDNIGIGYATLYNNTSGDKNTALGSLAAYTLTSGNSNTSIGFQSLQTNSTGSNNVAIGQNAGYNETGSDKLYIDSTALTTGTTATALIYGDFSTGKLYVKGNEILTVANGTLLTTTQSISGNLQNQINAIVQESTSIASSGGSILVNKNGNAFNLEVTSAPVSNHNSLLGLQGGISGQYYHLTTTQYASISGGIDLSAYTPLTTTSSISASFNSRIGTLETSTSGITGGLTQLDTRFVNVSGDSILSNGTLTLASKTIGGATITSPKGTGVANEGFGGLSLPSNTTGNYNTAVGYETLRNNTIGSNNTAIGFEALYANIKGTDNVGIGYSALAANISGSYNIAIGTVSLASNSIGDANTAIGYGTLMLNSGDANVAVGYEALWGNSDGSQNTAVGTQALTNNYSGNDNVAIGTRAMNSNYIGGSNIAIGTDALADTFIGNDNIAIGTAALLNNIFDNNIAIGTNSLEVNTIGFNNIAIGVNSLKNNYGNDNIAIGYNAGYNELGSNKFYVDSTLSTSGTSATALIYGDFITGKVYIKGQQILTSDDDSIYTLLSTTSNISGNLQNQINAITQESTTIASSGNSMVVTHIGSAYNIEVATAPIQNHNSLLGLQGGISGSNEYYHLSHAQFLSVISGGNNISNGIQGRIVCTNDSEYTITHSTINPLNEFPVVSLEVSGANSDLSVQGVYERTANSFKVVLSGTPNSSNAILYHISTQTISTLSVTSSDNSLVVASTSNGYDLIVNNSILTPYALTSNIASISGNLQNQLNSIDVVAGSNIQVIESPTNTFTIAVSGDIMRVVTLASAPTPTTTRVKGNYGYYGGYLYRWIDNSVVVRSLVETSW